MSVSFEITGTFSEKILDFTKIREFWWHCNSYFKWGCSRQNEIWRSEWKKCTTMVMSKTDTNDNETEAMTKQQWYHEKRNEKKKKKIKKVLAAKKKLKKWADIGTKDYLRKKKNR